MSDLVLYRFFDAEGTLLYVGITLRTWDRMRDHRHQSPFFPQVASVTFQRGFATVGALRKAEARAIRKERPLFNVVHKAKPKKPKSKPGPKPNSVPWYPRDFGPNPCGQMHYCGAEDRHGSEFSRCVCRGRDLKNLAYWQEKYPAPAHACWECPSSPGGPCDCGGCRHGSAHSARERVAAQ
jgi:hypothetical protein